jgi:hypothetical protein
MKPIDYAKAAGFALALLVINVLIAILVVTFYALLIEPGHPREFYDEAAKRIAPWCSHIAGTALFIIAGYFLTRHRLYRNAYLFVTVISVFYALIDAASVGFAGILQVEFALSMLVKLLAALAGAFIAIRATAHLTEASES